MNYAPPIRRPLEGERFQVIVIGGGINGVAIARECARAGRRTLLIEQQDFAAGTTSRATRIIHGGLRYLEHGEIGLVRESLRERRRLLQERPHLVHPIHFLLALDQNSGRSALAIRTGLWLYRHLGGRLQVGSSRKDQEKLERLLDSGRRWSVFSYEDAQCEFPERLVAEWLVEAMEAGAVARNHTQVLAVDVRHRRAVGVLLRDQVSGKEERVEGSWIINATGPWADRICQRSRIATPHPMVGGVRGSHIVMPRFANAPDAAVYTEAVDKRPIFVIPWNEQVLVGTTEVSDQSDPAKVQPSQAEIDYLVRSLLHLYPRVKLSASDIRYTFAGVRPLPFSPKEKASAVSRKHYLHDHAHDGAEHMISVIGGKLTTAAELARQCASKIGVVPKSSQHAGHRLGGKRRLNAGPLGDRDRQRGRNWGRYGPGHCRMAWPAGPGYFPYGDAPPGTSGAALFPHRTHCCRGGRRFCRRVRGHAGRCPAAAGAGCLRRVLVTGLRSRGRRPHRLCHGME